MFNFHFWVNYSFNYINLSDLSDLSNIVKITRLEQLFCITSQSDCNQGTGAPLEGLSKPPGGLNKPLKYI